MKTVVVKNQKIVYAILVAIILISGVIGAVLLVKNQEKMRGYVTTNARVVGHKERMEYDYDEHRDKYMYQEIVEYVVDGVRYTARSDVWTNAPKGIGGEMKIAYDPDSPSKCVFVSNSYLGIIVCFLMSAVGVILLIVTIVGNAKAKSMGESSGHLC